MSYNPKMANKGRGLEELIILQNELYKSRGVSNVQKISTPWTVLRQGARIVSAFPSGKSTLDFRGTVCGGVPISFDCKESEDIRGLPLSYLKPHQIDYIRLAAKFWEISFILCQIKPLDKIFIIRDTTVLRDWDKWQANKGKRGFNFIPVEEMEEIISQKGNYCDYINTLFQIKEMRNDLSTQQFYSEE